MSIHRVAILALNGVLPLDLGIPAQIFGPRTDTPYQLTVCADGGVVATTSGFSLSVPGGLGDVPAADTVIVPGYAPHRRVPPAVLDTLRQAHRHGRRLVSICTGAFALATAGLLDGRRATTHWQHTDELARDFPLVKVDPDVLYVDEGDVLTSAGVSCGIDLCLHMVRRDLGAHAANTLARAIVAAPHREGGQAQYIQTPMGRYETSSLAPTREWALEHRHEPLTIAVLADHAGVSTRTFARRFTDETGLPPIRWLLSARLDLARELLENSHAGVEHIARRCGLGTAANLRLHFRRRFGTTPTAYRHTFTTATPISGDRSVRRTDQTR
jgi:transcriptional regulator GlxA family with amidase domain